MAPVAVRTAAVAAATINKQVDRYSKYCPSPLSVQQFLDFGKFKKTIFS